MAPSERLSPTDVSSLIAERGPIHVHVGATMVLEGEPPDFGELLEHVEARLGLVPRFRQRLSDPDPVLINPAWTEDERFDLRWHVRRAALPRPGTIEQLRTYVGQLMSEPLDFTRPLWQLHLVEGLEGDRHAFINKTHHALVDGVAAVDVGTILLDPNPEGTEMPAPEEPAEPDEPSHDLLFVRAASERVRARLHKARKSAQSALTMPGETAGRVFRTAEEFTNIAALRPSCPKTSLNVPIGRDRRVAYVKATLEAIKDARAGEATVNDVILSVAAGALGRFLGDREEDVPGHLVALVPVSIRRQEERGELGNRIATILVPLPLREPDPAKRLARISAETARIKASGEAHAASLLIEATGWTPPTINRLLSGAMERPLAWNLVVSNVPGPQMPFYLLGHRLLEVYPFVPLSPQRHALSIGIVSYDGGVFFGLAGDRDVLADIDHLASGLEAALAEQTRSD